MSVYGAAQVLSGDASTMKTEDDCVRPHICEFDGTTFAETSQSGRGLPDRPRAKTDDKTRDTTKCRRKLVHLPSQMIFVLLKWPELSRNTFKSTFFRQARDRLRDRALRLRSRDSETRSFHFQYSGKCNNKWMRQSSDKITLSPLTSYIPRAINENERWWNSERHFDRGTCRLSCSKAWRSLCLAVKFNNKHVFRLGKHGKH